MVVDDENCLVMADSLGIAVTPMLWRRERKKNRVDSLKNNERNLIDYIEAPLIHSNVL